ncbi:helix-turn-helix domain-containing protein [Nonomuraea sp. NPDC046570]|uniref:winged helix-turn-helix domain-containing protein n=1 Tax=Nonomuraea sp. NPDC046570 TaxID=3155255 RepID=UPI00340555B5
MARGILRIIFTGDDLARVRVASRADPMWELVTSLQRLQAGDGGAAMTGWRREARANLAEAGLLPEVRELLLPLAPRARYFPDFLTPIEAQQGMGSGLGALLDTPPSRVRKEMELLRAHSGLPGRLEDLARATPRSMRELGRVAGGYWQAALAGHWGTVERVVSRERGMLVRHLAEGGVEQMLSMLPATRWRAPVLEIDYPAGGREVRLAGRGLVVVPSYFCRVAPVTLADPSLPPVLIYPVPRRNQPSPQAKDALAELLGRTRARVLRCIALAPGCSTTELARRAGLPPSSASEHARVLRQAGLIASIRHANLMLHQVTEIGDRLADDM